MTSGAGSAQAASLQWLLGAPRYCGKFDLVLKVIMFHVNVGEFPFCYMCFLVMFLQHL